MKVITGNQQRKEVKLWTEKGPGHPLVLSEGYNEQEEALFVAGWDHRCLYLGRQPGAAGADQIVDAAQQVEEAVHGNQEMLFARLDMSRIQALGNVTEDRLIHGLGIDEGLSLNLTIIVVQSSDESQIGEIVFSDGSSRSGATRGATASRIMHLDDEMVRVTLEVHNAGREPAGLRITEFMADPLNGPPEWIELENPDGFAMNLSGWSLARPGAFELIQDGALAAGEKLICTGNAVTQYNPNNAMMIDMAASGVLGTGTIDALAAEGDTITLGWTRAGTVLTHDVIIVTWDGTWNIQANHSMTYNLGGSPSSSTNWTAVDGGTPGW